MWSRCPICSYFVTIPQAGSAVRWQTLFPELEPPIRDSETISITRFCSRAFKRCFACGSKESTIMKKKALFAELLAQMLIDLGYGLGRGGLAA
jgi:hypothetical protein